jgi:hypothetical protein
MYLWRAKQDGCDFLIAEAPDGRLDLGDVYVHDFESDEYTQLFVGEGAPAGSAMFQAVAWSREDCGDAVYNKPPETKVWRTRCTGTGA